jgi:hypothetical protein
MTMSGKVTLMPASNAEADRIKRIVARVNRLDSGVRVVYVSGWQDRGTGGTFSPRGLIDHHDASSVTSGTWGAIGTVTHGRPDVPGPLSQFFVARGSVPQIAVVAAGRANHGGLGGPHKGIPQHSANAYTYGIEKANNGVGESYTDASIRATRVLFAAILLEIKASATMTIGHKEWAPTRKIDPRYSMPWMRNLVAETMTGEDELMSDAQYDALDEKVSAVLKVLTDKYGGDGPNPRQAWIDGAREDEMRNLETRMNARLDAQDAKLDQILAKE